MVRHDHEGLTVEIGTIAHGPFTRVVSDVLKEHLGSKCSVVEP